MLKMVLGTTEVRVVVDLILSVIPNGNGVRVVGPTSTAGTDVGMRLGSFVTRHSAVGNGKELILHVMMKTFRVCVIQRVHVVYLMVLVNILRSNPACLGEKLHIFMNQDQENNITPTVTTMS